MLDFVQRRAWHYLFFKKIDKWDLRAPKHIFSYVKVYETLNMMSRRSANLRENIQKQGEVEVAPFQREKIKKL